MANTVLRRRLRADGVMLLVDADARADSDSKEFPPEFEWTLRSITEGFAKIEDGAVHVEYGNARAVYRIVETLDDGRIRATLESHEFFDPPAFDPVRAADIRAANRQRKIDDLASTHSIDAAAAERILIEFGQIDAAVAAPESDTE